MNRYRLSKVGINVNKGIHRFNENKELYEKFLMKLPEDEYYQKMIEAIDAGDVEQAFQAAHAFKGLVGNLSVEKLFEQMVPLVEALRSENMEEAKKYLPQIKEEYNMIVEVIKAESDK